MPCGMSQAVFQRSWFSMRFSRKAKADHVVGQDFLSALGLRDEDGGASIPRLVCPYLAVLQCLSGVVGILGL
jgi:hypothetical protein